MSRIEQRFAQLKQKNRSALITYIMAYDPDKATSQKMLDGLPDAGADIIELGIPFSDPMADGPTIEEAGIRALKSGAKLKGILDMVADFRKKNSDTPIVLMGYYNPVHNYGIDKFLADAKSCGVDGLLIVDLPIEEDGELYKKAKESDIDLIKLATPTTDAARLQKILKHSSGFLYYVAVAGITGTKSASYDDIAKSVEQIKKYAKIPVAVGFGVKTAKDVENISKSADAVVVGSQIVKTINSQGVSKALEYVKSLTNIK